MRENIHFWTTDRNITAESAHKLLRKKVFWTL